MTTSNFLTPGTQLKRVIGLPDPEGGTLVYKVGEPISCVGGVRRPERIYVVHENGQMDTVPWARVEFDNGDVILVNLANVESVELQNPDGAGEVPG